MLRCTYMYYMYNIKVSASVIVHIYLISLIEIAASMRIDLKNNLVLYLEKKWVPLRTRICEKSIGGYFFLVISCKFCTYMYYANITENFSSKLIRS